MKMFCIEFSLLSSQKDITAVLLVSYCTDLWYPNTYIIMICVLIHINQRFSKMSFSNDCCQFGKWANISFNHLIPAWTKTKKIIPCDSYLILSHSVVCSCVCLSVIFVWRNLFVLFYLSQLYSELENLPLSVKATLFCLQLCQVILYSIWVESPVHFVHMWPPSLMWPGSQCFDSKVTLFQLWLYLKHVFLPILSSADLYMYFIPSLSLPFSSCNLVYNYC